MTGTALDLTGVACPMSWVRTKLALEKLDPGDELTVRLDADDPLGPCPGQRARTATTWRSTAAWSRSSSDDAVRVGLERYSRQLVLPEWSGKAQERLKSASAIVVGAGALDRRWPPIWPRPGSAGWASSTRTWSNLSNLHRQPLHFSPDVGRQKANAA